MRRLALLLAALCGGGADLDAPMPMLKVTLHHGAADRRYAPPDADESLARIEFCAYCEDPHTEGSLARGLTALQGARDYKITSKLVYALPNDAATPPMNADELTGNVAWCTAARRRSSRRSCTRKKPAPSAWCWWTTGAASLI